MATNTGGVFVATESGSSELDGVPYVFVKGVTRVREGHPLLDAVPDYFKPVGDHVHYEVEQATAAPGEKRGGTPTRAPRAKKNADADQGDDD